ncbi:MAG: hypothetical protein B7733_00790 [Myxococcales bacterium FL481]|nr:MAG: hypothetical protein B7733_00790 [Myxococcales bacterium FL481]
MAKSSRKLDELAALLERTGGDPERIEAVRRTQKFRRTWLELAEFLCQIRRKRTYERWGFSDFHAYCNDELTLKRATVDKLTMSYATLQSHAPQVLKRDGVARQIPSYEAIDYFAKAREDVAANDTASARAKKAGDTELEELGRAVFESAEPVRELRKRFDPVFFPQPKAAVELSALNQASSAAKRLAQILPEIRGLPDKQVRRLEAELGDLRTTLDDLALPLKEKLERKKKRDAAARERTKAEAG